jgi:hypothetical protein
MAKNDPLPDVAAMTGNTKVLMSWGAADGGFQYAMDLREKLMRLRHWTDPCAVYLDAKSIRGFPGEYPNPNIQGAVLNTHWKEYYQAAMRNAKVMVFIATPAWLASPWCAAEHQWFDAIRDGRNHMNIRVPSQLPIVVVVLGDLLANTRNDQVREIRADRLVLQGRALVTSRLAQLPVSERAVGKSLRGPAGALIELKRDEPAAAAVPKISAAIQRIAGI